MKESGFIPIKPCQKFNSIKAEPDTENAVTYMSLRAKGCPSKNAMHFCSKSLCRHDSTKTKDGPSDFRVLKFKQVPHIQGWNLSSPKYDLGAFHQSYKELVNEDREEELLQRHFILNEDKVRENFKKRIADLANYYQDLNKNYKFSDLPKKILLKKLRENKRKTNEERLKKRHYFLMNDIKFYTLGEEAFQEKDKKNNKNIISQMNLFTIDDLQKQNIDLLEESSEEEEDNIKESMEENLSASKRQNTVLLRPKKNRTYLAEQSSRRLGQFLTPENIDRLKRKTMIFNNLEIQTKFLNRISNMENVAEANSLNPAEQRLLKMKKSSIINSTASYDEFNNQQMSSLNFDSKKFVEEEFNKSKYLTLSPNVKPKRISILSPESRVKFKRQSIKDSSPTVRRWGSTFLSGLNDQFNEEDDFNKTLNMIVKRNADYWRDFSKEKHEVEFKALNEIIEKRQKLKNKYLAKYLAPEKKTATKGYINLMDTATSVSSSLFNSKFASQIR